MRVGVGKQLKNIYDRHHFFTAVPARSRVESRSPKCCVAFVETYILSVMFFHCLSKGILSQERIRH